MAESGGFQGAERKAVSAAKLLKKAGNPPPAMLYMTG
jgi:hypothetical protein